ncbi:lasso RiPP family leader peptide-containing protein [Streptomyces sp. NPDC059248]
MTTHDEAPALIEIGDFSTKTRWGSCGFFRDLVGGRFGC